MQAVCGVFVQKMYRQAQDVSTGVCRLHYVMQHSEVDPRQLRRQVEAEFLRYAARYESPDHGETLGAPWSRTKVSDEVESMATLLVEPYAVEYDSGDDLQLPENRLVGIRPAFVVAQDGGYFLLFDHEAENFVLAFKHDDGWLKAWGIRGDATSTFLAR
ncbi:MAG: hypothetical protein ABIO88_06120 [Burkholderiaceae bacterium]